MTELEKKVYIIGYYEFGNDFEVLSKHHMRSAEHIEKHLRIAEKQYPELVEKCKEKNKTRKEASRLRNMSP